MSQHSHNNGTPQGICYNYTMSLQCRINADARKGIYIIALSYKCVYMEELLSSIMSQLCHI